MEYEKKQWEAWKKFTELSAKISKGEKVRNTKITMPFIPLIQSDFYEFNELFRDIVLTFFGEDASMLTILKGYKKSLFEEIQDGYVVSYKWYDTDNVNILKKELKGRVKLFKQVDKRLIQDLEKLYNIYCKNKNKKEFLTRSIILLLEAYSNGRLKIWPKNELIKFADRLKTSLNAGPELLANLQNYIVNINIIGENNKGVLVNTGSRFTVELERDTIIKMLEELTQAEDMKQISNKFFNFVLFGLKHNKFKVEPNFFTWPIVTWFVNTKVVNLEEKTRLATKMFANPLRILFIIEKKMLIIEIEDGAILNIKQVESNKEELEKIWLDISKNYGFIHLAVKAREDSFKYSKSLLGKLQLFVKPTKAYEFYPKNQFVNEIAKKNILDILLNLALPFISS